MATQLTCQYSTWIRRPECPSRRYSSLPPEHPWTSFDGYLRSPEQSAACKHDGQKIINRLYLLLLSCYWWQRL